MGWCAKWRLAIFDLLSRNDGHGGEEAFSEIDVKRSVSGGVKCVRISWEGGE